MNARRVWAITLKDVIDGVRSMRLLSIMLLPLIMSLVFGTILQGVISGPTKVVVYDPGGSQLVDALGQMEDTQIIRVDSADAVSQSVLDNDAVYGLALPESLDASLARGESPTIQAFIEQRRAGASGGITDYIEVQARALAGQNPPARFSRTILQPESETNPWKQLSFYLLGLFLGMSLSLTGVMVPSMLLAEEKEKHTIRPLLTSPASVADLVVAKGIAGMVYVMVGAVVIVIANGGWAGQPAITLVVILASALFVVQAGLLLGSLFKDVNSLNTWSSVVVLPLLLPAMVVPLASMDVFDLSAIHTVLQVIPTYYSVHALERSLAGTATLASVGPDVAVLLACAGVLAWLTVRKLRSQA